MELIKTIVICYIILYKKFDNIKNKILPINSGFENNKFVESPLISDLFIKILLLQSSRYIVAIIYFAIDDYILTKNKYYLPLFLILYYYILSEWFYPKLRITIDNFLNLFISSFVYIENFVKFLFLLYLLIIIS